MGRDPGLTDAERREAEMLMDEHRARQWLAEHPGSVLPGMGTFMTVDEQGVGRIRPWQESSTRPTPAGSVGRAPTLEERRRMDAQLERLKATAPPIVKTSGIEKAQRMTRSIGDHIKSWTAMMGRPMVVGDLSPQMRRALHLEGLRPDRVITEAMVNRTARRYVREAENEMRAKERRKVTKEPYYVGPGVR